SASCATRSSPSAGSRPGIDFSIDCRDGRRQLLPAHQGGDSMHHRFRRRRALVALPIVLAFLGLVPVALAQGEDKARDKKAFFDVRQTPESLKELRGRAGALPPAAAALRDSLGVEGVVSIDPLTETARVVGRTDGFLTGPGTAGASRLARGFAT